MPLVIADRVRETTTTSGTGTITLAGPYSGFQAFSVIGNGNTTYYAIIDAQNGAWEVGIGAYTSSGNTLSRATVLASSNAGSLVNFGTGTKDVILTQPARRSVLVQEGGSGLLTGVAAFTANGVPYADSTSTLATSANMVFNGTRLTVADLADSGLTSGRVTYASTGGALVDSANLTFDGTTLTANALTTTSTVTINGGTANGVAYLNGSKVLTTGSALTFNGTTLTADTSSTSAANLRIENGSFNRVGAFQLTANGVQFDAFDQNSTSAQRSFMWLSGGSEQMRLTSTGLGIGTSSPAYKLDVAGTINSGASSATGYNLVFRTSGITTGRVQTGLTNTSGDLYTGVEGSTAGQTLTGSAAYSSFIGTFAANPLYLVSNATIRATLDSSGNLGLGVTPSATSGSYKNVQNGLATLMGSSSDPSAYLNANATFNSGWKYIANGTATRYEQGASHAWFTAPSGTAGNAISFTQAMTLDANGNLLVGNTSQILFTNKELNVNASSGSAGFALATAGVARLYMTGTSTEGNITTKGSIPLLFGINETERARIDSSGNLLVGTTSNTNSAKVFSLATSSGPAFASQGYSGDLSNPAALFGKFDNNTTTSQVLVRFTINNNSAGSGQINANGANSAAFGSFSDSRLKENITELAPQLGNIMALRPVEFDYIESEGGGHQTGFIAQEMQEVYPDTVGERADGMLTVTGWSKTEARLVKAIQELKAEFDAYKALHP